MRWRAPPPHTDGMKSSNNGGSPVQAVRQRHDAVNDFQVAPTPAKTHAGAPPAFHLLAEPTASSFPRSGIRLRCARSRPELLPRRYEWDGPLRAPSGLTLELATSLLRFAIEALPSVLAIVSLRRAGALRRPPRDRRAPLAAPSRPVPRRVPRSPAADSFPLSPAGRAAEARRRRSPTLQVPRLTLGSIR